MIPGAKTHVFHTATGRPPVRRTEPNRFEGSSRFNDSYILELELWSCMVYESWQPALSALIRFKGFSGSTTYYPLNTLDGL